MEAKSSRKFTTSVVLLGILILIVLMVLTYVILTQALNKPITNNNAVNNEAEITNNDVENDEEDPQDDEDEDEDDDLEVEVVVYFFNQNKFDAAESDIFSSTKRLSSREDIATFTLEQIIEGPTEEDFNTNLGITRSFDDPSVADDPFLAKIEGTSNCGGADFQITSLAGKIATVKFCKRVVTTGDFSSGIIFEQFRRTLTQFPTIEKVRVLRDDNSCFNDSIELSFEECVR